ncbi:MULTISPECIES: NAD(P)-dependent oxidoreductase [unclassified Amycolatopsis]|uniref:NAD(P)-dependent oxidoreductase n=1 Tax=unclassified Amycolatopsis TaxID=2618356 RepID=UPI002875CD1B|nr:MULTISPECIES: NAD(P)-dependent oxidoreductase [unclassified Amycolatopsis]MDS0135849.1 NAD(P)-dependent oxidoreductase [Amycolatopsis sp. 505]MDS0149679.1 NAD(P)-dependent oxidoreductase [Amycolatopsis sp. CM201R]
MTKTAAVLGTGLMGAGMARNLAKAGLDVTAWNRTIEKARPLVGDGITVAEDPAEAVAGADVVLTMLFDVGAVADVMSQALPAFGPDTVWVQSGTVGLAGTTRLADLARKHGAPFVDAPVLGTRQPAEEGKLIVLAGGPADLKDTVTPVFDAIGSRTVWVGDQPGDGHRLKIAANAWVLSITAATAQSVALADRLGIDPRGFLDVISGGPLDCAYAQLKGKAMISDELEPSFGLGGAVKDSALILDAMREAGVDERLMAALHAQYTAAEDEHGDEDMAAVIHVVTGSH